MRLEVSGAGPGFTLILFALAMHPIFVLAWAMYSDRPE